MTFKDFKDNIRNFLKDFFSYKSGVVGLVLLLLFLVMLAFGGLLVDFPQASSRWRDITYWEDNPVSAPPAWTNWFSKQKSAKHEVIGSSNMEEKSIGSMKMITYSFDYDYSYDLAPNDIVVKAEGSGSPIVKISVQRPDGNTINLYSSSTGFKSDGTLRVSLNGDAKANVYDFITDFESGEVLSNFNMNDLIPCNVIFSQAEENIVEKANALKGKYIFTVSYILKNDSDTVTNSVINFSGRVYGVFGTDASKRDIWSGLVYGLKWALIIGLLTSLTSVLIGVFYGVICAYYGGFVDSIMQRIFEIFVSVPLLPILIVLSAVVKPSIWIMILMMCVFFWTGPVKTVRSMALQIREETFVEASKALGASNARLIFKHIVPILLPYSFATMALSVPSAIVYEANISLIGLGDSTIVTWGQILHDAFTGGAVLKGMWWWVVPPGIMIALMGMTFAFIGFAMDKILQPKLRTR